jgi:hypothetical protein
MILFLQMELLLMAIVGILQFEVNFEPIALILVAGVRN